MDYSFLEGFPHNGFITNPFAICLVPLPPDYFHFEPTFEIRRSIRLPLHTALQE